MPADAHYAQNYKNLYHFYTKKDPKHQNFEAVCEAIDQRFGHLFSVSVLDYVASGQGDNPVKWEDSRYCEFFELCLQHTENKYTWEEIAEEMRKNLISLVVHNFILKTYLFVPDAPEKLGHLGFLEKFAAGTLSPTEPLSYIDLVRSVEQSGLKIPVRHIHQVTPEDFQLIGIGNGKTGKLLLVDVTQGDKHRMPKWVVVEEVRGNIQVFCETTLLEEEKKALQEKLKCPSPLTEDQFIGGRAAFGPSTGYVAWAYLKNQKVDVTNYALDLEGDFYSLLTAMSFALNPRWNSGKAQHLLPVSDDKATRYIQSTYQSYLPSYPSTNTILLDFTGAVVGLKPEGSGASSAVLPSDLCEWAKFLESKKERGFSGGSSIDLDAQRKKIRRSYISGMNETFLKMNVLRDQDDSSELTIAYDTNLWVFVSDFVREFSRTSSQHSIPDGASWIENYAYLTSQKLHEEFIRAAILTLFRGRAKKRKLTITVPDSVQLSADEINMIIAFMENNAYLADILIPSASPLTPLNNSLTTLKERLAPQLARNRWLQASGYLPPMADNFWKQAAKYALVYLVDPADDEEKRKLFRRCVEEMELQGLQAILAMLSDPAEKPQLERIYGKAKPVFYAACVASSYEDYLQALLKHLKDDAHFPFSEIALKPVPGKESALSAFIQAINQGGRFNQLQLVGVLLEQAPLETLLKTLIKEAQTQRWTTLLSIPALNQPENLSSALLSSLQQYGLLNNIILANRRAKAAADHLIALEEQLSTPAPRPAPGAAERRPGGVGSAGGFQPVCGLFCAAE